MHNDWKSIVRPIADGPYGIFVRNLLGLHPVHYYGPESKKINSQYSVSDLFFWQSDKIWRTRFDLLNISSFIFPRSPCKERVSLVVYNSDGQEKKRIEFMLEPFEMRKITFDEIAEGAGNYGTFAAFHDPEDAKLWEALDSCLCERGYVALQRRNEGNNLWSTVHGNSYAVAKKFQDEKILSIRIPGRSNHTYRPQVSFDDCQESELIIVNQEDRIIDLLVRYLDMDGSAVNTWRVSMQPFASKVIPVNNAKASTHRVEICSQTYMHRPLVRKLYLSHFDIFHG